MEEPSAKRCNSSNNSINRLSQLPQAILQQILCLLSSQKEAARTCVLSKSWLHIWSTGPKFQFSDTWFKRNKETFLRVLDSTLHGYLDQELCIQEFHVSMCVANCESVSFLDKWIPIIILNMGVKKFSLNLSPNSWAFPSAVLEAESSLQYLCLKRCNLDLKGGFDKTLPLKHLKTLVLHRVHINDETFHDIISSCLLIEYMELDCCEQLRTIKLMNKKALHNLRNFTVTQCGENDCSIEIDIPTLEFMSITGRVNWFHYHKFPNLISLVLKVVQLPSKSFDSNFSRYFPILEKLTIDRCYGFEEFQLSSHSVKYFSYSTMCKSNIKTSIDAPSILFYRNFSTFSGKFPPSIFFSTTHSEWKSEISLSFNPLDPDEWFCKLNAMLKALSQSKISLDISNLHEKETPLVLLNYVNGEGGFMNKPLLVLDDFILRSLSCSFSSAILNGLFRICRPRNIYMESINPNFVMLREHNEVTKFLCNIFLLCGNNQYYWQQDLEEVSMEIFDKNGQEWHPVAAYGTKSLSECAAFPDNKTIRFRIKWRDHLFN